MAAAFLYTAIMFAIAFALSMGVAALMKGIFLLVQHVNKAPPPADR